MAGRGRHATIPAWAAQQQQQPGVVQQHQQPEAKQTYVAPDGWTEHVSEDGKTYFYNTITQQSTYERPESLMSDVERKLPRTVWKEYVRDGKSYYFNAVTNESVWEEPMELTRYKERLRALCLGDAPTKDMASLALYNAARKKLDEVMVSVGAGNGANENEQNNQQQQQQQSKCPVKSAADMDLTTISGELITPSELLPKTKDNYDDEIKAFRQMLIDRKVPAGATWTVAMTYGIANDERFRALKGRQRKESTLAEYSLWKAQEEEKVKAENAQKMESELTKALEDLVAKDLINGKSNRKFTIEKLKGNPVLELFKGEGKRLDSLIRAFLDKLYKEMKEARKKRKALEASSFNTMLQQWEDTTGVIVTNDSKFTDELYAKAVSDAKAMEALGGKGFVELDRRDLKDMYAKFPDNKVKLQQERKHRQREELRQKCKDTCREFIAWLMDKLRSDPRAVIPVTFKEYYQVPENLAQIKSQPSFQNLVSSLGESEQDKEVAALKLLSKDVESAFDEVLDKVDSMFSLVRKDMKKHKIFVKTKYDEDSSTLPSNLAALLQLLQPETQSSISGDPGVLFTLFNSIVEDNTKRIKRKIEEYKDMLADLVATKKVRLGEAFEEAAPRLMKEEEWENLRQAHLRKSIFETQMEKMVNKKEKKRKGKKDEDSSSAKKSRKH